MHCFECKGASGYWCSELSDSPDKLVDGATQQKQKSCLLSRFLVLFTIYWLLFEQSACAALGCRLLLGVPLFKIPEGVAVGFQNFAWAPNSYILCIYWKKTTSWKQFVGQKPDCLVKCSAITAIFLNGYFLQLERQKVILKVQQYQQCCDHIAVQF